MWDNLTEKELEKFIRDNKDKFDKYSPSEGSETRFFNKLIQRFKKIISIVPYLVKTAIMTIIVFAFSIWLWNSFIRRDRKWISLPQKIENTYHKILHDKTF
jgi:hypothetical protein